jgi:hypothetical protein
MSEPNGHREHLEQRAAEVRSRLEQRLHALDERGEHVVEVAKAATRPPASVVILAAAGIAVAWFIVKRVRARRSRRLTFADLLAPALPPPPQKSFIVQGLEKSAASLLTVAVQRLGRRGLDQLLAEHSHEAGPEPPRGYY